MYSNPSLTADVIQHRPGRLATPGLATTVGLHTCTRSSSKAPGSALAGSEPHRAAASRDSAAGGVLIDANDTQPFAGARQQSPPFEQVWAQAGWHRVCTCVHVRAPTRRGRSVIPAAPMC